MRRRFDRAWPRLEPWGLRLTGAYISFLGGIVMVVTIDPRLGVVRAIGLALLLAGLLAVDRSREDVVTWTVQGVTGITFAIVFASLFSETIGPESDESNVAALGYLGVALWGLRIFRGAFRRRRDEHDISSYG